MESLTNRDKIFLELARRRRDEKFRYFVPNPAQKRWIDEIGREGSYIILNAGGNGSGKTFGLMAILAGLMWPDLAPSCFAYPVFKDFKHPKKIWVVSNPSELGGTSAIQATIDELWPTNRYRPEKNGRQYNSVFTTDTGWVVELKSTEQRRQEFRGSNIGVVAINEPLPEEIYRECLARTRKGGIIIGAMTSLDDEPWIVDGLLGKHDGKDYRILYGGVEENCKDHTPGGTLAHEQIERILSKYPADEQEARRSGKPLSLSGRIFKTFDRNIHVAREEIRPPASGVSVYQVVDPAGGKPFAIVWSFVDKAGNLTIFDEWPNYEFYGSKDPGFNLDDYVEVFKIKEAGLHVETRIIDRHFANTRHKPGAKTLREELAELNLEYVNSYHVGEDQPEVQTGVLKVGDYLAYNKTKPIDSANKPLLLISPNCKNTINSLEKWSRDPKTLKPKDDGFKDFSDCVRYLCMANPAIEDNRTWDQPRTAHYGVGT